MRAMEVQMQELLIGALLGAICGVMFERATSFFEATYLMVMNRRLKGSYGIWNREGVRMGTVTIRPRLGNHLLTRASHPGSEFDWAGSFYLEDQFMGAGHGVYRHINSQQADWGNHYIMLLGNGDIAVQWHNVSHAGDKKGSVLWRRESRIVPRCGVPSPDPPQVCDSLPRV